MVILILIPILVPVLTVGSTHAQTAYPPVSVTASPNQISFPVGQSGTTKVNVTSLNGFSGPVTLSGFVNPYPQLNVTFSPASFTLATGGTAAATATVSGNSTTTPAAYRIYVYANTGVYQITGFLNVTVTPAATGTPDYRLAASLTAIPLTPGASTTITVSAFSVSGFAGDISLNSTLGAGIYNTTTLHLKAGQIANATLTLVGSCPIFPGALSQSFDAYAFSGFRYHWMSLEWTYQTAQPMFCFTAATFQKIVIGSSASNSLFFGALAGFKGTVIVSAQSSFQTAFFPNNNVSVPLRFYSTESIDIAVPVNTTPGNYTLVLTGTSGSLSWKVNETIQAVTGSDYFTMIVNPASLTITQGSTRNLVISLTGQAGFSRHVELFPIFSNSSLGYEAYPPIGDIIVSNGQTTGVTFVVYATNVQPGVYSLWMQAESLYMPYVYAFQIIPIVVQAAPLPSPDVSISANPSSLTVQAGASTTVKLTIAGLNGYVGTVVLGCSVQNPSLNCWLDTLTMLLDPVSKTVTLNVATDTNMNPGTYSVVASIEAFAPSGQGVNTSHSVTINLTVTTSNIIGVSPTVFYSTVGAVAGVGAITGTTVFILRRERKRKKIHFGGAEGVGPLTREDEVKGDD